MTKTFTQSQDEIAKLCGHFATNRQAYLAPGVKEAHVRQSLIDPFFEALGWDVRNAGMAQRQIDATDAEIDRLVYDLYGLTAEEIAIVEGKDE